MVRVALEIDELSVEDVTDHSAAARAEVADGGELLRAGEPELRRARWLWRNQIGHRERDTATCNSLDPIPSSDVHPASWWSATVELEEILGLTGATA